MNLSDIATTLHTALIGRDAEFDSVSIDTRTLKPGQLFIALRGPKFDAHDFIAEAKEKGAVGVLVSDEVETSLPIIRVQNTRTALAQLGSHQRDQIHIPISAVTGSCGKTTTRAMLANVLQQCGNVLASENSFNNDIGVPLTLLRLNPQHDFAVFELGANHPGEIAYLTHLVKPQVAIITNAGHAHLEGFGDLEGVARAKGEIFQGLSTDGIAIINNDDRYAPFWCNLVAGHRVMTFAIDRPADVMAVNIRINSQTHPTFRLVLPNAEIDIELPLLGKHNVYNALATAAAACALNLPVEAIKKGLESVVPVKGRLVEKKGYGGALIIDDSYNANPASVTAAIQVLASRTGDSVFVLGDMKELGPGAPQLHRQIGEFALQAGIARLYGYGQNARHTVQAFGKNAYHFDDKESLIQAVKSYLHADAVVLVKGSLSMGMASVVSALLEE